MRFRELRRLLREVVIAGLPLGTGCIAEHVITGNECVETVKRTIPVSLPADPPLQLKIEGCRVDVDACQALCEMVMQRAGAGPTPSGCKVEFHDDLVSVDVTYQIYKGGGNCPVEGRRPDGLAELDRLAAPTPAGAWLAQAAWLEAASVHAFARLAQELTAHDAPAVLVRGALFALRDELRHTAIVTRLAARYGATPPAPVVAPLAERPLEALALENAVEGCVRETWAAVLALWQSQVARDPVVRAAFATIARDELRHAALAWAVDRWSAPLLDAPARARIAGAREAAARELADAPAELAGPWAVALGLPDGSDLRGLVGRTRTSLWQGGRSCRA